jgi:hypothetical protein
MGGLAEGLREDFGDRHAPWRGGMTVVRKNPRFQKPMEGAA